MTFVDSYALLSSRIFSKFFIIRTKFSWINSVKFHMDRRDEAKLPMDIINVPPIVTTYRQALRTFDVRRRGDLSRNLTKLKGLMDNLRAEHFSFDDTLNDPATWDDPDKAPCTYIEVFQNSQINMSIFVLRPGYKMPLHDHPQMHGLLKVISGAVNIRSFSEYPLTQRVDPDKFAAQAKEEAARLAHGPHVHRKFFAKVTSDQICRQNAETCLLTPTISNYHEIEALKFPAAFFDILSPPYDTMIEGIGPRRCRYYEVAKEVSTNIVELQEIEAPDCFYCDTAPYLGPMLS